MESGCKSTRFTNTRQIYKEVFFEKKDEFICKRLRNRCVLKHGFEEGKGKEEKGHIIILYKGSLQGKKECFGEGTAEKKRELEENRRGETGIEQRPNGE
ncbi:hypothetical protein [Bacteroides sp.]|uniref:hypothetical protein n=1 Tax=Bacteroides sp. TaxID=29523 RepID=UPI0035282FB2